MTEELARGAGNRLVPGWAEVDVEAHKLGGLTGRAFKVTSKGRPGEAYCARIFEDPLQHQIIIPASHTLAAQGLTPAVVGADSEAIVTNFVSSGALNPSTALEIQSASRLGSFTASLHRIPIEANAVERPKALPADLFILAQPLQESAVPEFPYEVVKVELELLEQQLPNRIGGSFSTSLVWTHGDFHLLNILENHLAAARNKTKLQVIDVQYCGARPATTDIAYLFVSLSMIKHKYPTLEWRQTFAQAYLEAMKLPQDETSVEDLLWSVECEAPYQFAWMIIAMYELCFHKEGDGSKSYDAEYVKNLRKAWEVIPLMRTAIVDGKDDEGRKHEIVQHGACVAELRHRHPVIMFFYQNLCHIQ